jgi:M6 family metalloprotease-like protein
LGVYPLNSLSSKFIIGIIVLTLSFPISPQTRSYVPEHADEKVRQPASMTDSLEQVSPEETLEGSLMRIWDAVENTREEAAYYLNTQEAGQVRLEIPPELFQAFKSFVVDQPYLLVTGAWQADHSAFQVQRYAAASPPAQEDRSASDRAEPGWTVDGSKITGNTPWVTVLCKFPDIEETPYDMNYYLDMYGSDYPELNDYWKEASNNAINLDGSTVAGWYTLPYDSDSPEYTTGATIGLVRDDCLAAADDDVDFSQFYGVNLMFNHNIWTSFAWGGCGTYLLEGEYRHAGITTTFPGNGGGLANLVHEMGHGYCLPHSFINEGDQPYGNVWDVMSSSYSNTHPLWGSTPQHTLALNKYNLGWIDESEVLTVQMPFDQTFVLARTAQPLTEDYRMAKIIPDEDTIYTLETRQTSIPYDSQLPASAVIIHKYNAVTDKISLITEGGSLGSVFPSAYWTVGETYVDVDYGLTFTVTGATDTGFVIDLSLSELTPFEGCSAQSSIPVSECETLVSLYNELNGPNWTGPRGWLTHPDPCMWTGVTCSDGVVTELLLLTEYLTGALPQSIGEMINLRTLRIEGNLTGTIPPDLGNLSQLEELKLPSNQLTGRIPPELGSLSNLTSLDLFGNQLTGSIPTELTNLTLLTWLRLSDNLLTGTLPEELGNMTSLVSLLLDDNQLYGPIPSSMTQLTEMYSFSFRNTYLCEPSASETAYWNWVATMPVENYRNDGVVCYLEPPSTGCAAQSSIPVAECDALLSLYNALDGPGWDKEPIWLFDSDPCTWGGVTCSGGVVTGLDLATGLTGTIPDNIGDLANLTQLHLESEGLTGGIPVFLGEMSQLQSLTLKGNLTQTIPAELGNLSNLQTLNLQGNQLTGLIPTELSRLSSLEVLNLQGNQLTGSIPPELGQKLHYYFELNLSDNQLTGTIPSTFFHQSIFHLNLSNNLLSGPIPPGLAESALLRTIDLHGNAFTGAIPAGFGDLNYLTKLDLSDNQLDGYIPPRLGWLGNLEILDLSNNNLSGTLPDLSRLGNVVSIVLDDNTFFGTIPQSIVGLTNIRTFSFRYTNLCEPSDPEFQTWKDHMVEYWYDEGAVCEAGLQFYLPLIVD